MTSVIQDCLGCGLPTDAPSPFCSRCAELVEFERYHHPAPPETRLSDSLMARKLRGKLPIFLTKVIFPGPILLATLAGILVIGAILCQSPGLDCSLFDHCLLA